MTNVFFSDDRLCSILNQFFDMSDSEDVKEQITPSRTLARDRRAMARTRADIKELPDSYVYILDMPGLKPSDIKVQVKDKNILLIIGERQVREDQNQENVKYLRTERASRFKKKFALPEDAKTDSITAHYEDGVLTVKVPKKDRPEPQIKSKIIEVPVD